MKVFAKKFPMGLRLFVFGALLVSGSGAWVAAAPDNGTSKTATQKTADVKADLKAFKVTGEKGEKLVPAESAGPGDIIEYQVRYTNDGAAPAQNFAPQLPVPTALVYIAQTATPDEVLASTDEKN